METRYAQEPSEVNGKRRKDSKKMKLCENIYGDGKMKLYMDY